MVSFTRRALATRGTTCIRALVLSFCSTGLLLGFAAQSPGRTIVRFDAEFGSFDVELFDDVVPTTVNNFLSYVTSGRYANTLVHRTTTLATDGIGIIQGGTYGMAFDPILTGSPIPLEYQLPNTRGTLSMVRSPSPNTATSGWFINTTDNSTTLGQSNGGGFAVFGQVLGNGMNVVDDINAFPRHDIPSSVSSLPFTLRNVPLHNFTPGEDDPLDHTVVVNGISVVPEPSTSVLALTGTVIVAICLRRRRRRSVHS